ncbi:hypothetical protein BDF21DRAFT_456948 [Thamnidium elegans]|nr:hypothetical protein BDF21DRAFT_456948 [Thamnidium elegans]
MTLAKILLQRRKSPRNTLTHHVLESTAVTFTTVVFINNIFLSCNDIVGLSWFEKEACTTGSTKLDGIALAVKDRKYDEAKLLEKMAGLIENKLFFGKVGNQDQIRP